MITRPARKFTPEQDMPAARDIHLVRIVFLWRGRCFHIWPWSKRSERVEYAVPARPSPAESVHALIGAAWPSFWLVDP